jgi:antitoxin PrlF
VIDFQRAPDGHILLVKVDGAPQPNRSEKLRGRAGKGLSTDEIMAPLRGED